MFERVKGNVGRNPYLLAILMFCFALTLISTITCAEVQRCVCSEENECCDGCSPTQQTSCNDGLFCTTTDTCSDQGACVGTDSPCSNEQTCSEEDKQCCESNVTLQCSVNGDVAYHDSCGQAGTVVEDCHDTKGACCDSENGGCTEPVCGCGEGWTGFSCDSCVIYVMETGDDDAAGSSWATAKETIQAGLDTANSDGCKEVWVASGVYKPTDTADRSASIYLKSGIDLYGGFAGGEWVREQRDPAVNETILSGNIGLSFQTDDNSYHVVEAASNAIIDSFTIEDGNADGAEDTPPSRGGGLYVGYYATPFLVKNCTFQNNLALQGGGIGNYRGSIVVLNSRFLGNEASRAAGGGDLQWRSRFHGGQWSV
jgi:hypothetical protein